MEITHLAIIRTNQLCRIDRIPKRMGNDRSGMRFRALQHMWMRTNHQPCPTPNKPAGPMLLIGVDLAPILISTVNQNDDHFTGTGCAGEFRFQNPGMGWQMNHTRSVFTRDKAINQADSKNRNRRTLAGGPPWPTRFSRIPSRTSHTNPELPDRSQPL